MNIIFLSGSGAIEFEEFMKIFLSSFQPPSSQELSDSFKMMDKNGDGFLSKDEIKEVMKTSGQPMSDAGIDDLLKGIDVDNDGKINYQGSY